MDRLRRGKHNRRKVDIVYIADEIVQAVRVEGELWGDAVEDRQSSDPVAGHKKEAEAQKKGNRMKDVVDDDVMRQKVMRQVELAVREFGEMLYPYTKSVERHPQCVLSNAYREPEMWQVAMDVPVTMSDNTVRFLETLGHEYIVGRVIEEWCRRYNVEALEGQMRVIEDLKTKIEGARDKRVELVRRKMSPY